MSGRRRGFEEVYEDHYDAVLRYALRRTSREDALDAAAETFEVAWRRRRDMPAGRELPWLYGVARNVLSHQRRSARRRQAATSHLGGVAYCRDDEVEIQVVQLQQVEDMVGAINRLGEADQEVIRLAGWEELDREELSVALGCTPNAATKRLNRALDHLAHELGVVRHSGGRFFTRRSVAL
jgi:RNA polymerase sigma factor (sigma-70 family)